MKQAEVEAQRQKREQQQGKVAKWIGLSGKGANMMVFTTVRNRAMVKAAASFGAGALALCSAGAAAQVATPSDQVASAGEIVVTANKRVEKLSNIAGAISVELQPGRPPALSRHRDRYMRYWHAGRGPAATPRDTPDNVLKKQ